MSKTIDLKFIKNSFLELGLRMDGLDVQEALFGYCVSHIFKRGMPCGLNDIRKLYDTIMQARVPSRPFIYGNLSKCRYCGEIIKNLDDAYITYGYWAPIWFICHKACKEKGEQNEAYECQCIDTNCNDCLHFERRKGCEGVCKKTSEAKRGFSNYCTPENLDCFQHRRDKKNNMKTEELDTKKIGEGRFSYDKGSSEEAIRFIIQNKLIYPTGNKFFFGFNIAKNEVCVCSFPDKNEIPRLVCRYLKNGIGMKDVGLDLDDPDFDEFVYRHEYDSSFCFMVKKVP